MNMLEYVINGAEEECFEVVEAAQEIALQAARAGKALAKGNRFGLSDTNPRTGVTNMQALIGEFNDLTALMYLLKSEVEAIGGSFEGFLDPAALQAKQEKFAKWAKRSVTNGVLQLPPPLQELSSHD